MAQYKKPGLIIATLMVLAVLFLSATVLIRQNPEDDFLEKRAALVVRKIGHELLLHANDSSSRVLPVKQMSKGKFQLEFQSPFSFMPDSLVEIVRNNLASAELPLDYIVNVVDCKSNEVVYGFEIGNFTKKEIVPCLGRVQPMGCYLIQISFINFSSKANANSLYPVYAFALIGFALIAFIGRSYFKAEKNVKVAEVVDGIGIGAYSFSMENQFLYRNNERIELSVKEAKLLSIFATRQNELISREELLKKVWEDEGVITGRSLDMFVSKLRKKLINDPSVQIIGVHGKGYRLETNKMN